MRGDFFEFPATHKIFLYSNHKPTVRGTDWGFWRKLYLIPFIETITDEEKDANLPAKLRAESTVLPRQHQRVRRNFFAFVMHH